MDPLLKRAIIKLNPDYFSLSDSEQLPYRLNLSSEHYSLLKEFLIAHLFGHEIVIPADKDELLNCLTEAQATQLNATLLPWMGIGDDHFFLNEQFGAGKTLLDFDTLHDYDLHDFEFQQHANQSEDPDYPIQPYRGMLYSAWARLLLDDAFTYATLFMAASYIQCELDGYQDECIQALIPHEYVEGKNHGKQEGAHYLWDFQRNAHGKEPQLDELITRSMRYLAARYQDVLNDYDQSAPGQVYIVNCSRQDDPTHHFIFSDKELLKRIHFKTFMKDCRLHEASDLTALFDKINTEKISLKAYLEHQYHDIMANFDPTVVKLKKKRKIIVHKDAGLDDLL